MKRVQITLLGLLMISAVTYAATMNWNFDKSHSKVKFIVEHMKITEVTGSFEKFDGEVKTQGENFEGATINVTIDVASVNTDNKKRDKHLRSKDFFHAEKYPKIKFRGTNLEKAGKTDEGNTKYDLTGKLTMRGHTQQETFTAIHNGTVQDPFSDKKKAGWKIKGKVNRYDYGLKWDKTTETGNLIVGKQVEINCDVELGVES